MRRYQLPPDIRFAPFLFAKKCSVKGIRYSKNLATEFVQNAKDALAVFQDSTTKEVLLMIADYTLSRNF